MMDLLLRRASGSTASCSARSAPAATPIKLIRTCNTCIKPIVQQRTRRQPLRGVVVCSTNPDHVSPQDVDELLRDLVLEDNDYEITSKINSDPNFDDPEWYKRVTDWGEFWNHTKWELETEGLEQEDDELDAAGNPVRSLDRLWMMLQAIKNIDGRPDVINWMPPTMRRQHIDNWDVVPVAPEKKPELVVLDINDARAMAEKRRKRELLDIEWQRRKSLLGKATYADPYRDVRMIPSEDERREWTDEEIKLLITNNGAAAKPEDHKGWVENPLAACDWVQTMGVQWVEETEDFLERIGHMAAPEERERLEQEVVLDLMRPEVPWEVAAELLGPEIDARKREEASAAAMREERDNTWYGDRPKPRR